MRIPRYYCRVCGEFKKRSEVCAARGYRAKRCGRCGQVVGKSIKMLESAIDWTDFLKAEYGNLRKSIDDIKSKMGEEKPDEKRPND